MLLRDKLQQSLVAASVTKQIFCSVSGAVLDVDDAVVIEMEATGQTVAVVTGAVWDAEPTLLESNPQFVAYDRHGDK